MERMEKSIGSNLRQEAQLDFYFFIYFFIFIFIFILLTRRKAMEALYIG